MLREDVHLFDIKPKARYGFGRQGMNYELYGDKYIEVPNEPEAFVVNYYLKTAQKETAHIAVADGSGAVVREFDGPTARGLNHAVVPLGSARGRGGAAGRGGPADQPLPTGSYQVTLTVAGRTLSKTAVVRERIR